MLFGNNKGEKLFEADDFIYFARTQSLKTTP
jgi:hypothetical protein